MRKLILPPAIAACAFAFAFVACSDPKPASKAFPELGFHESRDFRFPLEIAVATAARIAVVRIHRLDQLFADKRTCGFRYHATVEESFKGGDSPFTFFSAVEPPLQSGGTKHLVIAYDQPIKSKQSKEFLALVLSVEELPTVDCWGDADAIVPMFSHSAWQFDTTASRRFGGEWIRQATQLDIQWCVDDETRPMSRAFEAKGFRVENLGSDVEPQVVIEWKTVKRLIERAIRNSPYANGQSASWVTPIRSDVHWGPCSVD